MRYYKNINNGYILAIGTGGGGTEITEDEYGEIMTVIRNKPQRTETTDYRLRTDLTWEQIEVEPPALDDTPPENLAEAAEYLLKTNSVELPSEEEPDYLNEHEPDPNYFG